ncbi:MAG: MBL fold metallo-hydrolase [Spirochaetota bacterium]
MRGLLVLLIVYNNLPAPQAPEAAAGGKPGTGTAWGMACVVRGLEKTLLFDTGGDGDLLVANMRAMGVDPRSIEVVFLSHAHRDHTGGLDAVLELNPGAEVWLHSGFPRQVIERAERAGAQVRVVEDEPVRVLPGAYSTGVLVTGGLHTPGPGSSIPEQALVLNAPGGLVVLTGCSHPGVVHMARAALDAGERFSDELISSRLLLVTGGFHLGGAGAQEVRDISGLFRGLGVEYLGPNHCTGDRAIRIFRQEWGDRFVETGCGAVLEIGETVRAR